MGLEIIAGVGGILAVGVWSFYNIKSFRDTLMELDQYAPFDGNSQLQQLHSQLNGEAKSGLLYSLGSFGRKRARRRYNKQKQVKYS